MTRDHWIMALLIFTKLRQRLLLLEEIIRLHDEGLIKSTEEPGLEASEVAPTVSAKMRSKP